MKFLFLTLALSLSMGAFAQSNNVLDDFDPSAPGAEAYLEELGMINESETGISTNFMNDEFGIMAKCRERTCPVFIEIKRSEQRAYLFIDGTQTHVWKVSTGKAGHGTPAFEGNPDGKRIFIKKDSSKYPSKNGGYKGMGNMPYAVMYNGPYGIHGTAAIPKLGVKDSHGCTRLHPDNAKIFNSHVRRVGASNVWISIR